MSLDVIMQALQSQVFYGGVAVGLAVGLTMMFVSGAQKRQILLSCAEQRTPEKLGDRFYYIVPEEIYTRANILGAEIRLKREREGRASPRHYDELEEHRELTEQSKSS